MLNRWIGLASVLLVGGVATAHEGMGPHGGRLADLPKHHLELVVKADMVEVFVSDKAGQPIPAHGLTGFAIVVAGGSSTRIALTGEGAKLSGAASAKLPDGAKSVVQVMLQNGQTIQATFD